MRKRWIYLSAALMLLAGACMKLPMVSGAAPADPVDLETGCTLNVSPVDTEDPEKQDYREDMQKAQITLDLYLVADAEEVKGYDVYQFRPGAAYSGLDIAGYEKLQELTAADWDALAQTAAGIALDAQAPQTPVVSRAAEGAQVSMTDLDAGLYLLVARGTDLDPASYVKTVQTEAAEGETQEGSQKLVTVAHSDQYEYQFTPQLIALPTKQADADGTANTAGSGPWLYTESIYLKSGRESRNASLEIVKTLRDHEAVEGTIEPVTFVFRVVGTLGGEEVYNEVASLTFTGPGTGRTTLERIPAMATVTVTEIYNGLSYTQTVPAEGPVVLESISAEPGAQNTASFENVYNNNRTHGSGIRNQFVYNAGSGSWEWTPEYPQQGGE